MDKLLITIDVVRFEYRLLSKQTKKDRRELSGQSRSFTTTGYPLSCVGSPRVGIKGGQLNVRRRLRRLLNSRNGREVSPESLSTKRDSFRYRGFGRTRGVRSILGVLVGPYLL